MRINNYMELNKIQLNEDDNIFDVAEKLGLDIKLLKKFHNDNSEPHNWIREDFSISNWTNFLMIPDSVENLIKRKQELDSPNIINLVQKLNDNTDYSIVQKIDMQIDGVSMIDSETHIVWGVKKEMRNNKFLVKLFQKSHQIKYIKSIYRQFAEFMQKINKPIEYIVLELSSSGKIDLINNQEEIKHSWKELREILEAEMGDTLEEKSMLEGGDNDFSNTLPLIKNNILYHLFFNDIFYNYTEVDKYIQIDSEQYASQIFSNEKVNVITKRKVEKKGNLAKIKFYRESDPNKNDHLRNVYNDKLKEFLQDDYSYELTWSMEYLYDIEKGKMISCLSKIKEKASSKYNHLMEHNISIIKD